MHDYSSSKTKVFSLAALKMNKNMRNLLTKKLNPNLSEQTRWNWQLLLVYFTLNDMNESIK